MEIRLADGADEEAIQAFYAPIVERTAISLELSAPTVDQMRSRMLSTLEELPWLICEDRGETLGYAYAARFRPRPAYRRVKSRRVCRASAAPPRTAPHASSCGPRSC